MFADPASSALSAVVPPAVVVAEDLPVAVPALCTAALGVAAAAAIAVTAGASTSAVPAAEAAAEMPRQTVDQILLFPSLRLSHGLRARGQTNQRRTSHELVTS
jgi:hypothetical protein